MKIIRAYFIPPDGKIELPEAAEFLAVRSEGNYPELIFIVDTAQENVTRTFKTLKIGKPVDFEGKYLGMFDPNYNSIYTLIFEVL